MKTDKAAIDRNTLPPALLEYFSTHGHVVSNGNGTLARCGGPGICHICSGDAAILRLWQRKPGILAEAPPAEPVKLWLVGKAINTEKNEWEYQGIFRTEEQAANACQQSADYFSAPVELDKLLPYETLPEWPGAKYYPQMKMNLPSAEWQEEYPMNPRFLQRLEKFASVPEVQSFALLLRSKWEAMQKARAVPLPCSDVTLAQEVQAIRTMFELGDTFAAFVEALAACSAARGKAHALATILSMIPDSSEHASIRTRFEGIPSAHFTMGAADVLRERVSQETKWGLQNHAPDLWLVILSEEVGELAQAILHTNYGGHKAGLHRVRAEALQVAAVALAMVECLDRSEWTWPDRSGHAAGLQKDACELWQALAGIVGLSHPEELAKLADLMPKRRPSAAGHAVQILLSTAARIGIKSGKADSKPA